MSFYRYRLDCSRAEIRHYSKHLKFDIKKRESDSATYGPFLQLKYSFLSDRCRKVSCIASTLKRGYRGLWQTPNTRRRILYKFNRLRKTRRWNNKKNKNLTGSRQEDYYLCNLGGSKNVESRERRKTCRAVP